MTDVFLREAKEKLKKIPRTPSNTEEIRKIEELMEAYSVEQRPKSKAKLQMNIKQMTSELLKKYILAKYPLLSVPPSEKRRAT